MEKIIYSNSFYWSFKIWSFQTECLKIKCIEQRSEVLSSNSDNSHYSTSIVNVCLYLAETYEDDFISAASNSGQMSVVETTSMINDVGLNISYILHRILRNKLGAKIFEPEHLMKALNGNMILPRFEEYHYYHEAENKSELILFSVRDIITAYKKETQMLIDSGDIYILMKWIE